MIGRYGTDGCYSGSRIYSKELNLVAPEKKIVGRIFETVIR